MTDNRYDLLLTISSPPTLDLEALELGMACAAFDQSVAFVFSGRGLEWLIEGQSARRPGGKAADKLIKALAMYDCEDVYYLEEGVTDSDTFVNNVRPITRTELSDVMSSSKHRLNF